MRIQMWEKRYAFYLDGRFDPDRRRRGADGRGHHRDFHSQLLVPARRFKDMRVRKLTAPQIEPPTAARRWRPITASSCAGTRMVRARGCWRPSICWTRRRPTRKSPPAKRHLARPAGGRGQAIARQCLRCRRAVSKGQGAVPAGALRQKPNFVDRPRVACLARGSCSDAAIRDAKSAKSHATRACELTDYKTWYAVEGLAWRRRRPGILTSPRLGEKGPGDRPKQGREVFGRAAHQTV